MAGFLGEAYLWVKALHILAVIAWMAGFLYLPRLFVYHCQAEVGSVQSATFKVMERRLLRGIMNPSMIVAWAAGLALAVNIEAWSGAGWFHAKLTLLVILTVLHMAAARWRRAFAEDANQHSERFYRIMNEVPAVLMVGIVILVVVKPF
jgi:putative membrane protein